MDLEIFHQKLLGHDQDMTPEIYRLTKKQQKVYAAFKEGKRGCLLAKSAATREDPETFLATFVLAVYQTTIPTPERVAIAVPKPIEQWSIFQIRHIAKRIFSTRRKAAKSDIDALRDAIHRIELGSSVIQIQEEPERWVSFGFKSGELIPPWMRNRLTKV